MKKILVVLSLALPVFASAGTMNFAYKITGDKIIAPIQAFDDGDYTYLQQRDIQHPPAVFDDNGNPVQYVVKPPYLVVTGVYSSLLVHYGRYQSYLTNTQQYNPKKDTKKVNLMPVNSPNLWYGDAKPDRITGNATDPIPALSYKIPITVNTTSGKKDGVTGQFFIEKTNAYTKVNSKIIEPEYGVKLTFADGMTKLTPRHIIMIYKLVDSIGKNAKYSINSGKGKFAKKRADNAAKALERVGASLIDVTETTTGSNDLIINVDGKAK